MLRWGFRTGRSVSRPAGAGRANVRQFGMGEPRKHAGAWVVLTGDMAMRTYGLRVGATSGIDAMPPGAGVIPSDRTYRRRLDDAMVAVFDRACNTNNLDAAADVLEVLIAWHRRRSTKYGRERRISDDHLKSMLAELKRLTTLRKV
jgi:hypothetical protein